MRPDRARQLETRVQGRPAPPAKTGLGGLSSWRGLRGCESGGLAAWWPHSVPLSMRRDNCRGELPSREPRHTGEVKLAAVRPASLSEAAPRDLLGPAGLGDVLQVLLLARHVCTCEEDWRPLGPLIGRPGTLVVHRSRP